MTTLRALRRFLLVILFAGMTGTIVELLLSIARATRVGLIEINVDEGDVDAQRFYERHGFAATEPGSTERAVYYFQELPATS